LRVAFIDCPCGVTHWIRDPAEVIEAEIASRRPYQVEIKGQVLTVYPELQVLHHMEEPDREWRYHR